MIEIFFSLSELLNSQSHQDAKYQILLFKNKIKKEQNNKLMNWNCNSIKSSNEPKRQWMLFFFFLNVVLARVVSKE
jgi:hypothetical protein